MKTASSTCAGRAYPGQGGMGMTLGMAGEGVGGCKHTAQRVGTRCPYSCCTSWQPEMEPRQHTLLLPKVAHEKRRCHCWGGGVWTAGLRRAEEQCRQ